METFDKNLNEQKLPPEIRSFHMKKVSSTYMKVSTSNTPSPQNISDTVLFD